MNENFPYGEVAKKSFIMDKDYKHIQPNKQIEKNFRNNLELKKDMHYFLHNPK